ncbi:hypothetical protein K1T71_013756 [Dendrolimus kikuchii]|uniref:Uncharacterized protein n=1 Tax=Dendrolimus kikuchii TaxID=765133 RepID=A0ACC1CHD6_9NEOP|nr:hypothetical protein K1T71_013756 [Dendrolimus kikuchii]
MISTAVVNGTFKVNQHNLALEPGCSTEHISLIVSITPINTGNFAQCSHLDRVYSTFMLSLPYPTLASIREHKTVTHYNIKTKKRRITTTRKQFEEQCDTLRYYCMRAYKTGWLCASTLYYIYRSFENQCELDYVNCMERYEVWQIAHMSKCFDIPKIEAYLEERKYISNTSVIYRSFFKPVEQPLRR